MCLTGHVIIIVVLAKNQLMNKVYQIPLMLISIFTIVRIWQHFINLQIIRYDKLVNPSKVHVSVPITYILINPVLSLGLILPL